MRTSLAPLLSDAADLRPSEALTFLLTGQQSAVKQPTLHALHAVFFVSDLACAVPACCKPACRQTVLKQCIHLPGPCFCCQPYGFLQPMQFCVVHLCLHNLRQYPSLKLQGELWEPTWSKQAAC